MVISRPLKPFFSIIDEMWVSPFFILPHKEVTSINFFGKTGSGATLPRVETVKAGAYWLV